MFLKFVTLILVLGATGIGMLSVRQSRLQAVHEMAESRQRTLQSDERAGEIRSIIVRSATPQRVRRLMEARGEFVPATSAPSMADMAETIGVWEPRWGSVFGEGDAPVPDDALLNVSVTPDGQRVFTLRDGTQVVFVEE